MAQREEGGDAPQTRYAVKGRLSDRNQAVVLGEAAHSVRQAECAEHGVAVVLGRYRLR